MVADVVEDEVVALGPGGEVDLRVVDDVVGADRADQLDVLRAADPGHLGAERLGDLHGERAHATGSAVDEDLLTGLDLAVVAQELERGRGGHADRGRLLEGEIGRLLEELVLCRPRVLGEGSRAPAEDLVARLEPGHIRPDRLDRPRDVGSGHAVLRPAESGREAHDERRARHEDPVTDMDGCRMDANQHLVGRDLRLVDVLRLEDLCGAVAVLNDRLHG